MTRNQLMRTVAYKTNFYQRDVERFIDKSIEAIVEALIRGENINLNGFITIKPIDKPERQTINPATQLYGTKPAHTKIKAYISPIIIDKVNKERRLVLDKEEEIERILEERKKNEEITDEE